MHMKLKSLIVAVNLLAAVALPLTAADVVRLDTTPTGNKIRMEGTSTIHDWQCEGRIIGGFVEAGAGFPLKPGAEVKPGKADLKASIKKDGKPYDTAMDKRMYQALSEETHKRITYTLTGLTLKEAPKTADAPYQYEAVGELVVAGVTNKVTMPVTVTVLGENKVKFVGSTTVKMTDFKVEPPALTVLGLGIKTGDEVKLFFEWVAAQRPAPAAKP
jgi:hypothetical protein